MAAVWCGLSCREDLLERCRGEDDVVQKQMDAHATTRVPQMYTPKALCSGRSRSKGDPIRGVPTQNLRQKQDRSKSHGRARSERCTQAWIDCQARTTRCSPACRMIRR